MISRIIWTGCFLIVSIGDIAYADPVHQWGLKVEHGLASSAQKAREIPSLDFVDRMQHRHVLGFGMARIDDGKIPSTKDDGVRSKGTDIPIGVDTLFQLAPISQAATAEVNLQLVTTGSCDLAIHVNDDRQSWQVSRTIRTAQHPVVRRELLARNAGPSISRFLGERPECEVPATLPSSDNVPPAGSQPVGMIGKLGTKPSCLGGGTTIQQRVREDVTRTTSGQLTKPAALELPGMNDSNFVQPSPESLRNCVALTHQGLKSPCFRWNAYAEPVVSGLWTTPTDLAKFAIAVREVDRAESERRGNREMSRKLLIGNNFRSEDGFACGLGSTAVTNGGRGRTLCEEIIHGIAKVDRGSGGQHLIKAAAKPEAETKTAAVVVVPHDQLKLTGVPPIPQRIADTASRYVHIRQARFASWHPQRREMLVSTRFADTAQIHHLKFPGGARTQLTFFKEPVRSAAFQPIDGGSFCFARDVGGGEFYQNFRFDISEGVATLLTDGKKRNALGVWSNRGDRMAYTRVDAGDDGAFTEIRVVPPSDPKQDRMIAEVPGGGWGILDWSPNDNKLLAMEYISINESYLWTLDVETGNRERLTNPTGDQQVSYGGGQWSRDGKRIFTATDTGGEFRQLHAVEMDSGRHQNLTSSLPWDVSGFDLSPDGNTIVLAINEAGISRIYLLNTESAQLQPIDMPIGIVSSLKWHPTGNEFAMTFSSATSPADVYSFLPESRELVRWTNSETGPIDNSQTRQPELIHWPSFDGRQISGFLYSPPKRFTGKRPVIVKIHGGPESQSRPGYLGRMNYFVDELGIAVILPNVRGSRGYGKSFLKLDNGLRREGAYRDIEALLNWIAKRRELDADRILVTGGSYGGHMTLASAARYNERIRCSIDIVGISNLRTFLENTQGYRRELRRAEYGDERNPEIRSFLNRTAPLTMADQIRKPMLVVQGRNDPRVPVTESDQIVETLQKTETPVWYIVAEDEGHGFRKKKNADFQFYATVLFIERYLLD